MYVLIVGLISSTSTRACSYLGKYPAMWGEVGRGGVEEDTGRAEVSSGGTWKSRLSLQEKQEGLCSRRCPEHSPEQGRVVAGRFQSVRPHSKGQPSTLNSKTECNVRDSNELPTYLTQLFFQLRESTDSLAKIF